MNEVKECDVKGCTEKAEVFTKDFGFCKGHWQQVKEAIKSLRKGKK